MNHYNPIQFIYARRMQMMINIQKFIDSFDESSKLYYIFVFVFLALLFLCREIHYIENESVSAVIKATLVPHAAQPVS